MKPFTSKHCTPINYGSPLKQKNKPVTVGENTSEVQKDIVAKKVLGLTKGSSK